MIRLRDVDVPRTLLIYVRVLSRRCGMKFHEKGANISWHLARYVKQREKRNFTEIFVHSVSPMNLRLPILNYFQFYSHHTYYI